ncbi:hypothetical protein [Flavobacterium chryseum]|uniref:hypothetical protein n=1 Tax=Flavobacterium sp. P3160 TaxID=2512113 RepID=UPI00105BB58A|nr:hypothetical protein [Flavobacterium sp. P3160]
MKSKILEIVESKHKSSNGSCGTTFADVLIQLKVSDLEFQEVITEMYNNDEVEIREGINGFMVMKKCK